MDPDGLEVLSLRDGILLFRRQIATRYLTVSLSSRETGRMTCLRDDGYLAPRSARNRNDLPARVNVRARRVTFGAILPAAVLVASVP